MNLMIESITYPLLHINRYKQIKPTNMRLYKKPIKYNHAKLYKKLKRGIQKSAPIVILIKRICPHFVPIAVSNGEPMKIHSLPLVYNCYIVCLNTINEPDNDYN